MASRTTPTPTPSSKESAASSAASDDWEKELELDLTEDEKNMAEKLLSDGDKVSASFIAINEMISKIFTKKISLRLKVLGV